jgi:hypothetical protein
MRDVKWPRSARASVGSRELFPPLRRDAGGPTADAVTSRVPEKWLSDRVPVRCFAEYCQRSPARGRRDQVPPSHDLERVTSAVSMATPIPPPTVTRPTPLAPRTAIGRNAFITANSASLVSGGAPLVSHQIAPAPQQGIGARCPLPFRNVCQQPCGRGGTSGGICLLSMENIRTLSEI